MPDYSLLFSFVFFCFLLETSQAKGFTTQSKGHWTPRNMRLFMEKFAKNRNMDPLLSGTWHNSLKTFAQSKVKTNNK